MLGLRNRNVSVRRRIVRDKKKRGQVRRPRRVRVRKEDDKGEQEERVRFRRRVRDKRRKGWG